MESNRINSSEQRLLLLLLPLIVLALSAFVLDPHVSYQLDHDSRDYLSFCCRLLFPCLFLLCTAFLVQSQGRVLQLTILSLNYALLLFVLALLRPDALLNPAICVLSAASAVLVLRPGTELNDNSYLALHPNLRGLLQICFALLLPLAVFLGLYTILRQIEIFVIFTINENFGGSLLSMILSPIYLILHTFGFQGTITNSALIHFQDDKVNAFINSVFITNFIALPCLLLTRAFQATGNLRLFFTLLAFTAVLTASIGPCISLICLIVAVMLPGTFILLTACSLAFFLCSSLMNIPALTTITNLYRPDIDMSDMALPLIRGSTALLHLIGIIVPILSLLLLSVVKSERLNQLHQRRSISKSGLNLRGNLSPDLSAIVLLRALGGISNIGRLSLFERQLSVEVQDHERCQAALLSALTLKKPHYDKNSHSYLLDLGDLSAGVASRLQRLTADNPGIPAPVISTRGFKITPMPHIKNSL